MEYWNIRAGRWWMIQWCVDRWFSLGVHIDFRSRIAVKTGERFGPYVDFHLGCVIVSFGVNPRLSGELHSKTSISRGGVPESAA